MVTIIKYKLLKIPVMLLNFYNSEYSQDGLHQFSLCCKKPVKCPKVCSSCGKTLQATEILKGVDEKRILTTEQQEQLKNLLENQVIEILSFGEYIPEELTAMLPFIKSSKTILPSISKGFRQSDIIVFYAFKKALKEKNYMCVVRYTTRGKEHLGYLLNLNEDLVFIEIPFAKYFNHDELNRLKDAVGFEKLKLKSDDIEKMKNDALMFIQQNQNGDKIDINMITSESKILLKEMIKQAQEKSESQENGESDGLVIEPEQINPFKLKNSEDDTD